MSKTPGVQFPGDLLRGAKGVFVWVFVGGIITVVSIYIALSTLLGW